MASCSVNITSNDYSDFIFRHNELPLEQIRRVVGTDCVDYVNNEYAIVYVPYQDVAPLSFERHSYNAIPKLYALLDTSSMEASGILSTFNQPVISSKGEGVIIGFIDTGINYRDPLFRNADGSTRILGIWDQNIYNPVRTEPPYTDPNTSPIFSSEISYGTEFTKEQIDLALTSPDPLSIVPSTDTDGHGTFLAGIAAGGVNANETFTGAAPESSIVMVKLKPAKQHLKEFYQLTENAVAYQENDIMMGIRYLMVMAARYRMPLVVCLGLGTNQGSHQGTSPLGLTIRDFSRFSGAAFVAAAGNEAGLRHHYFGTIPPDQEYEDVELRVAQNETGIYMELWGLEPELYTVGFVSPTGEVIRQVPNISGNETVITFTLEETVITINYITSETGSGGQLIAMHMASPTAGIWHIRVYNALYLTGRYHIWLPVDGFISPDTVFLQADPFTTITDPANSTALITASTYNHVNNSLYIHSSRGYNRIGDIKPDLAAPGVDVYGPGLPPASGRTALNGDTPNTMTRKTGSSIAAAHTAGAVADLFHWCIVEGNIPDINGIGVKTFLIRGADRNPALTYPNREWGFGTLNLYDTFIQMRTSSL